MEKNDAQGVLWFRKASEQGHAEAQFHLAWAYHSSRGVEKDDTQAVLWYRKAAEQGHAEAQFEVGAAHADGCRVPQDYVEAYKWLSLAALHSSLAVDQQRIGDRRDAVAKKMSPAEITEAQKRAREWTVASEQ